MTELIQALTRAANAVADYYEKQAYPLKSVTQVGQVPTPAPAPRTRRTKVDKDVSGNAPEAGPSLSDLDKKIEKSGGEMSEAESLAEIKQVAKTYIGRFAAQLDGVVAFRKLMSTTCGVGKLDDLTHAHRLQVISAAKAEIAKADVAKVPAGSGVEV